MLISKTTGKPFAFYRVPTLDEISLKGVFAKNERGYRLNAI